MQPKIFLSGGMTNLTKEEASYWRSLISNKIPNVIDPTKPYLNFTSEKEAMIYDLHHVRTADIIIVNFNSLHSIGTAQEIMLAYSLNKTIIGIIPEENLLSLHPWYKEEIVKLFTYSKETLEETICEVLDYICIHYV